ncbi:hypothetical protein CHS0354_032898 [Potamilus streckersoni]|uniref:Uncharacterized protein n=1 Tax=Potamilus streckersoni TaxID=2493646 RepID=A0AAE0RWD4_9BIVA|nr:hypothetical protein CHS0354_032898 [Potamilus streckersoni]
MKRLDAASRDILNFFQREGESVTTVGSILETLLKTEIKADHILKEEKEDRLKQTFDFITKYDELLHEIRMVDKQMADEFAKGRWLNTSTKKVYHMPIVESGHENTRWRDFNLRIQQTEERSGSQMNALGKQLQKRSVLLTELNEINREQNNNKQGQNDDNSRLSHYSNRGQYNYRGNRVNINNRKMTDMFYHTDDPVGPGRRFFEPAFVAEIHFKKANLHVSIQVFTFVNNYVYFVVAVDIKNDAE